MHTSKSSKKKKHENKKHSKKKSGIKTKASDKVKAPQKGLTLTFSMNL